MYLLALETATIPASFAIAHDDHILGAGRQETGERAAESLLARIDHAFRDVQLTPRDIDVVGLTIGPGSFTGLRCGVAIAKLLAYSTGCRVVALDSMQVIAASIEPQVGTVRIVMDAQRNGVYWQQYVLEEGKLPQPLQEVQVSSVASFLGLSVSGEPIAGPGLANLAGMMASDGESDRRLLASALVDRVARLARWQAAANQFCDAWNLVPKYVGRSAAEEKTAMPVTIFRS